MIPKIEFRYSDIYDRKYKESKKTKENLKKKNKTYPSRNNILNYIEDVKKLWDKKNKKILKEISKVSGLKWKEKKIICYVIGAGKSFSDPLTIKVYEKEPKKFVETLTHELIHQIQTQNKRKYLTWHKYVLERYKNEEKLTQNHILLSAMHWKILEKLEGEEGIKKEIKKFDKNKEYKRAWEIVKKETPDSIIKKFKEIIK
jgi:hypothetical protein